MSRTLAALDAEWSRLASSSAARAALARWAQWEAALMGCDDLDDVLEARRDPAVAGAVMSALGRLSSTDELAARVLFQAMLPGIIRIPNARDGRDAVDGVLGLAWERIRTYPAHRPGSVAGNILLDVRKQYLRQRKSDRGVADPSPVDDPEHERSPEDVVVEVELLRQLGSARRRGLISDPELRAIVRTRIECESPADAADLEDVTVRCLLKRRWRGERALRATLGRAG